MRRHAWLLVLAALVAVGKAVESPPSARGLFPLRIRGKFLEPGSAVPRAPLALSEVREAEDGGLEGTAWAWFVPADFKASRDLRRLVTRPRMHDPNLPPWDLWRHRHGYRVGPAKRAAWNGLGDDPEWMDPADAEFYDAYLIALFRLWTRRALKARLAGNPEPVAPAEPVEETVVSIPMQYDETGLAEPVGGAFVMHQWNLPVRVAFTLLPSTSTHAAEWWFEVGSEPFVRYDKNAWRERHGYRKTLLGYRWDADFPGGDSLDAADGRRLDALMERGIAFWANAALQRGLFELDQHLKSASREFRKTRYPSAG